MYYYNLIVDDILFINFLFKYSSLAKFNWTKNKTNFRIADCQLYIKPCGVKPAFFGGQQKISLISFVEKWNNE